MDYGPPSIPENGILDEIWHGRRRYVAPGEEVVRVGNGPGGGDAVTSLVFAFFPAPSPAVRCSASLREPWSAPASGYHLREDPAGLFPQVMIHVARRVQTLGLRRDLLGFFYGDRPDDLFDLRDVLRGHAHLAQPHSQ